MTAVDLVTEWCGNWPRLGADAVARIFTPDASWTNMPMPGQHIVGPEAIAATLQQFIGQVERVDVEVHHVAEASGGVVLAERTETFVFPSGKSFSLPVAAVFETADGRITAWRDYFDMEQYRSQLQALQG